ncbi:MAG: hypothetical protein WB421_09645 [Terriglobales bacterium]
MNRKSFAGAIETEVLIRCLRRCALCFALAGDTSVKRGQLAHIDRNPVNASKENAAFLCMPHHDEYDSTSRQTKRITPTELKAHQESLHNYLESPGAWLETRKPHRKRSKVKPERISLELYDRRLPVYRVAMQFLRVVHKDYQPDIPEILKFARDTDEALFLFDEMIAEYLAELLKKALRLRAVTLSLERGWTDSAGQEDGQLTMWFSEQVEEIQRKFAPYLRPKP